MTDNKVPAVVQLPQIVAAAPDDNNGSFDCKKDMDCDDTKCRKRHSTHSGISPLAVCHHGKKCRDSHCVFYHDMTEDGSSPAHAKHRKGVNSRVRAGACHRKFCKDAKCNQGHDTPDGHSHSTWCEKGKYGIACPANKQCVLKHIRVCVNELLCRDDSCPMFHLMSSDGKCPNILVPEQLDNVIAGKPADTVYLLKVAKALSRLHTLKNKFFKG